MQENLQLLQRLQNVKPSYPLKKQAKDFEEHLSVQAMMRKNCK